MNFSCRSLNDLPTDVLSSIASRCTCIEGMLALSETCHALWSATILTRGALATLKITELHIRMHCSRLKRVEMNQIGLVRWTQRIPSDVRTSGVRAWRTLPCARHATRFARTFGSCRAEDGSAEVSLSVRDIMDVLLCN